MHVACSSFDHRIFRKHPVKRRFFRFHIHRQSGMQARNFQAGEDFELFQMLVHFRKLPAGVEKCDVGHGFAAFKQHEQHGRAVLAPGQGRRRRNGRACRKTYPVAAPMPRRRICTRQRPMLCALWAVGGPCARGRRAIWTSNGENFANYGRRRTARPMCWPWGPSGSRGPLRKAVADLCAWVPCPVG